MIFRSSNFSYLHGRGVIIFFFFLDGKESSLINDLFFFFLVVNGRFGNLLKVVLFICMWMGMALVFRTFLK